MVQIRLRWQPTWRIDPETLTVSKHEPVLNADTDKDVGFTGLVYSAEEDAFFAVSDFGALWRIDPLPSLATGSRNLH